MRQCSGLLLQKSMVPLPLPSSCLDSEFPSLPGASPQRDAGLEGMWLFPSTISKLLVCLGCTIKCQASCCSRSTYYHVLRVRSKEGAREDEALINLSLPWTKSSQRDCIFVTSQTNLWCVCTVCVCVFLLWLPGTDMSSISTLSFY